MQHINIFTKTRWLVTIILLTTLSIGQMWGADPSWTHTFSSTSAPTVTNNQVTVNSVTWDLSTTVGKGSPTMTSGNDNSVRAWKFGSGSNHYYSNITLSTNYFSSYNVKSVEIIGCGNAAKNITISVTQGTGGSAVTIGSATINQAYANSWQNNSNCKKTINTNKGNGGVLTISFSPTTCAFSLRQIKVTYEEVTVSCTATPSIGAASLNGPVSLSSVPFTCTLSSEGGTGCSISAAGFVWKAGSDPSASDNPKAGTYTSSTKTVTGTIPSSGSFSTGTTYYVKAYATNSAGTAVSSSSYQFRPQSISYNGNTSTSGSMNAQYVEYNKAANLTNNAFSKTGHSFAGWATSADGNVVYTNGQSVTATSNLSLYAKWTKNSYTLTWNLNGGTVSVAGTGAAVNATGSPSSSVPYGNAITAPTVVKTGYTQNGWNSTPASTMPASNTTYTAQWTANKYDITYKDQGGGDFTGTQTTPPTQHTYGTATTLKIPTKTGYTFGGWFTASDCASGAVGNTTSASLGATDYTAAITLYAKWTKNSYTLTWNLNGGKVTVAGTGAAVDATGTPNTSVPYNDAITAPTVTKYGYTFSSWNNTPASTMPAANTTYTAQWTAKSFDVTWKVNGNTVAGGSSKVDFNSRVNTLPTAPTPPCGDRFMGWTTDEEYEHGTSPLFTTADTAPTVTVEGNVTYYAVFADYAE